MNYFMGFEITVVTLIAGVVIVVIVLRAFANRD
jgi:hypothetical protein